MRYLILIILIVGSHRTPWTWFPLENYSIITIYNNWYKIYMCISEFSIINKLSIVLGSSMIEMFDSRVIVLFLCFEGFYQSSSQEKPIVCTFETKTYSNICVV